MKTFVLRIVTTVLAVGAMASTGAFALAPADLGDAFDRAGSTRSDFVERLASAGDGAFNPTDRKILGDGIVPSGARGHESGGTVAASSDRKILGTAPAEGASAFAQHEANTDSDFAAASPQGTGKLQYRSGGHVLGFDSGGYYASNGTYALRVTFQGGAGALATAAGADTKPSPETRSARTSEEVPILDRVTYQGVWPGIDLEYDAPKGGIARSTWTIAPGADTKSIRMHYNRPVSLTASGALEIGFETGTLTETAPIAWQEVDGKRQAVAVRFAKVEDDIVGFAVGDYRNDLPLRIDPTLVWNTFLGGSGNDYGNAIAVDASGNVYVSGESYAASWGNPKRPFTAGYDAFAAKLDVNGALVWSTFLGGSGDDYGSAIAVDATGSVYVSGSSDATWGSPKQAYTKFSDVFAAKLSSGGALLWNTFLGGSGDDYGSAITVGVDGNVYVAAESYTTWGSPVRSYTAGLDAVVVKIGSDGLLKWNTFLGGSELDHGSAIAVDVGGNIYAGGTSTSNWGSPQRPYTLGDDAFAAKISADGTLLWNTFLGGSGTDSGRAIAMDTSGNVLVGGETYAASWGSPKRSYTAGVDAFAAKLDSNGSLLWNTFLGGSGADFGRAIAVDASGNAYVSGYSRLTWGSPERAFTALHDAFAAKISPSGAMLWHTFLGGTGDDFGNSIALNGIGNVFVGGTSAASWSSPQQALTALHDAFAARIYQPACGNFIVDPGEDCDDGNVIGGDCCSATCTSEEAGSTCLDGNLCNGSETCDGNGICRAGTALNCDDGNGCTADTCSAAIGCGHAPETVGTPCGSGIATTCDGADTCDGNGACLANLAAIGTLCRGATGVCDVAETCDGAGNCPANGSAAAGAPCGDGDLCNGSETCDGGGTCRAGAVLNCDDGNACTADTCNATTGCGHVAESVGTPCGSALASTCDGADTCDGNGACLTNVAAIGTICRGATGVCDVAETCNGAGICPANGFAAVGAPCGDGDLCNGGETCDGGGNCRAGTALNCDDGNLCTQDSCDPVLGCTHVPIDCSSLDYECLVHTCQPATGQCVAASSPGCLDLVALEPVQVLQNWGNSISPLVAGKSTFVRAHLQTRDGSWKRRSRPVVLEGWRGPVKLGTLESINDRVWVSSDASAPPSRTNVNGSPLFRLPTSWTHSTFLTFPLKLIVRGRAPSDGSFHPSSDLDERAGVAAQRIACREADSTPRNCTTLVSFRTVPAPAAIIGQIAYTDRNGKRKVTPWSDAERAVRELTAAWPIAEGDVSKLWKREIWDLRIDGRKLKAEDFLEKALERIQGLHNKYDFVTELHCPPFGYGCVQVRRQNQKRLWIGILPETYYLDTKDQNPGLAGKAYWSKSRQNYASVSTPSPATVLQEVGHNFRWDHTRDPQKKNCGKECGACGEQTDSGATAYPDWASAADSKGNIRRLPVLTAASKDPVWGFAVDRFQENWEKAVIPPRQAFSFMSYCWGPRGAWMDLSHYLELQDRLRQDQWKTHRDAVQPELPAAGQATSDAASTLGVRVSGNIDPLAHQAELSAVEWWEGDETTDVFSSSYLVEALDVDGTLVGAAAFDRTPETHTHQDPGAGESLPWSFSVTIPDPDFRSVAFRVVHDGVVIGEFAASASPPTIQLLEPNGGGELNGKVTVSWQVEDADGDAGGATLFYSRDGGTSWQVLATDLEGTSHEVDLDELGGGSESLFKIAVTDGYWFNDDISDASFSVRTKGPRVQLLGAVDRPYRPDEQVDLSAEADDLEGDVIDEEQTEWRSDRDGLLGSGKSLERLASTLSLGDHLITARATDASGDAGEASVLLRIESRLPACRDGLDNDGDGFVDFGSDAECTSQDDDSENPDCADGIDNDGDGHVDYPEDASCEDAFALREITECSDGIDNDRDGAIDGEDSKCPAASSPTEGQPNNCGDASIGDAEQCDDGNRAGEDGCSDKCEVESGWRCGGSPSECSAVGLQDAKQSACIKALHKTLAGVATAQGGTNTSCLQSRRLDPGQDAAACIVGDRYGLVGKAIAKVEKARTKVCSGTWPDFGASKSDATPSSAARQRRALLVDVLGGRPDSAIAGIPTPRAAACQSEAIAAMERYTNARIKAVLKCESKRLASVEDAIALADCVLSATAADPKIRAAFDKMTSSVKAACSRDDIPSALPGGCNSETADSLPACLDRKVSCRLCVTARSSFALPVDCDTYDDGLRNESCNPALILDEATGDGIVVSPPD